MEEEAGLSSQLDEIFLTNHSVSPSLPFFLFTMEVTRTPLAGLL